MTLDELNALDSDVARDQLLRCCGSSRWASAMAAARPFGTTGAMQASAAAIWSALGPGDWLEAFAAHPRIGEASSGSDWSAAEQERMQSADAQAKAQMAALNRAYESRFGYIFIICATGKSPEELRSALESRLGHDAGAELPIAADEQRKITALRLARLVET